VFYEKPLTSFSELVRRLKSLDQDAGIRLVGRRRGRKVLVFVTRFGPKYTVMTYSVNSGTGGPGRRLNTSEFDSPETAGVALRNLISGRLHAWLY
jgi:hypothetical protein